MAEWKDTFPKWLRNEEWKDAVDAAINEGFRDHKATVAINNDRLLVLDWKNKDGCSNNEVHYILDKVQGGFIIYGDLGETTACWRHPVEPKDLISYLYSLPYFLEKIEAGRRYIWDIQKGLDDLEERLKHLKEVYEKQGRSTDQLIKDFKRMEKRYEEYTDVAYPNERIEDEEFCDLWVKYFYDETPDIGLNVWIDIYLQVLGFFMACDDAGLLNA